jgi:NADPH2:quinone reductase
VVAAGRHRPGLEWLESHGATATVDLEESADLSTALTEAAGGPIDVVVDVLWGAPAEAAIEALGDHGRLVNVGNNAGTDIGLPLQAMRKARTGVFGMSSGWTPLPEKMDAYESVLDHIASGRVEVAHEVVPLDDVAEAWDRQGRSPHTKLVISLV